jgi:hypothetical protein
MSALKTNLQSLAASFADDVVRAIRGASLQELLGEVGNGPRPARRAAASEPSRAARRGRLKRRSAADISNAVDRIAALLGQHKSGLRAEQIRQQLRVQAKELPRPLTEGLKAKRYSKRGQKRATVYFVGAGGAAKGRKK